MLRALRTITAVMLLALWVPATAHCSLETVVDSLVGLCGNTCDHVASEAHLDACSSIESGDYRTVATSAQVVPPLLSELACLACLHASILAEAEPLAPPAWLKAHPLDWVPAWSFTLRAAPPARAPSQI